MNILITGNPSSLSTTLSKELAKQKHRVVLASDNLEKWGISTENAVTHSINPARDIFRDALSSYGFEAAIFIATREEQLHEQEDVDIGHELDGLRNTLELFKNRKLKHFFYISSTEVYGDAENPSETTDATPCSINGYTLLAGEHYCKVYQESFGLNLTIVRLPYIYGPDEKTGFLYKLVQDCKNKRNVWIPGAPERVSGFLHVDDVADFLKRAIDEEYSPASAVVNLSPSETITNSEISEELSEYFPKTKFHFDGGRTVCTRPVPVSIAKNVFDWIDLRRFRTELANYPDLTDQAFKTTTQGLRALFDRFSGHPELLKWIELILGAVVTQFLSQLTGTLIQYKYVDFRLLFVVIMASVYGLRFGLLAAFFISLSLIYTWYQLAIDWNLIIYNVGNWFPVALYFVTGLIIGYSHDRNETILANERKQTNLIYEKYKFLYEVFNEIRKLKDEFREQVIGYRDSFGKIYTITQELDTLEEQSVYIRALAILEELMQNDTITIYSLEPDLEYARLEVSSVSLGDKLSKSLKLSDYPEIMRCIEEGSIFQNTSLLPNYPAYIAPVLNNSYPFNVPVAIIVIWSVKFDQFSTYYLNLFKVISGLIQASLVRATKFLDANYEKVYIPSTRILKPDAFMDVIKTREEMRRNKIADYQLIVLERPKYNINKLDSRVREGIHGADIVGIQNDGNYYILLSQADTVAANDVIVRLSKLGIKGRLVNNREIQGD